MLQDRYETDKLFDSILKLTNQMDPVLAQIDQVLEDEALFQLIRNDLAKRYPQTEQTGRHSTPVEVIVRMLAVKENQLHLYEDLERLFSLDQQEGFQSPGYTYTRKVDNSHGRMEIRECWAISEEEYLAYVRGRQNWKNLSTLAMIRSERRLDDKVEIKIRYFISSAVLNAKGYLKAKRSHWGIENCLHWELDVAFREDVSRVRKDHAPANFAILRHMALNMLKQEKSAKVGIQAKRLQAGWDENYLLKVLSV